MSVHYEFFLACDFKADTPKSVIDILTYLVAADTTLEEPNVPLPEVLPDHPFFRMYAWGSVLYNTAIYPGEGLAKLIRDEKYELTVRVSVRKGYDLIAAFLDWLTPYIDLEEYMGTIKSDEDAYRINLILLRDGSLFYQYIDSYAQPPKLEEIKVSDLVDEIRKRI